MIRRPQLFSRVERERAQMFEGGYPEPQNRGAEAAMSNDPNPSRFMADGPDRVRAANRSRIEQEVRARYAAELAKADICDSLVLEVRIRAEIERTLAETAPREALY
jgi:hypothetical protein